MVELETQKLLSFHIWLAWYLKLTSCSGLYSKSFRGINYDFEKEDVPFHLDVS